ncbi:MAG: hypothetical protein HUJ56_11850, partial [Erysipelotrichaceae bacterium]|nr:hypothetical protein [Erysipelotrichaceae bacterium]
GSNTRFEFNANYVTLTESGANGTEIYEQNIQLDSAEYLLDVSFDNNDVGLLEPNFTSHMGVIAYENALANQYSNFYEDMLISPFPLNGKTLLFYRKSEEGIIYYYQGDGTKGEYIINGFEQYKCGVDLQTSGGVSIVYVDNYTGTLYLNNNLIKVGFDRIFGTVNFYVYDITTDKFIHTNGVKLEKYDGFELVSLNDDKAQVKFGETIWTMWRGHPYIQCEHIDTDLRVIDNYDTINCESLRTPDGRVLYDGKGGKAEVDLNNTVTTTKLRLEGTDVPSFIGGTEITAIATVYNNEGDSIGFVGNDPIGKMEFIINGNSEYVDPKPSLSNTTGEYEWVYKFTPPSDNAEYNMVARFLPLLNYFGSDSLPFYYDVHRLETGLDLKVNNSSNECVDVQLPVTDSNPVVINAKVLNSDDESISGVRVTALDLKTSKKIVQAMTSETGVDLKIPNNKITGQGIYEYYVVGDATETYDSSEDYAPYVRVYDSSKNPVLDTDITYTDVGKKIVFQSFEVDNPCRVKVNNDEFEVLHTYNYPITHSGTYNIKIFYDGDDNHQSYYHSGTITIDKEPLDITANFSKPLPTIIPYNSSIGINGSVSIQEPISVTLYDNGVPVSSTRAEDTFSIFYLCDKVGGHNLTIEFAGNEFISSASASLPPITVGKNDSVLRRCNGDVYRETTDMFQLVDSFDNPLSGKLVKYTINGVTYTRTTKEDGTASKLIQLFSGSYNVTVEFDGDDICTPCKLEYVLVVKDPLEVWNKAENVSTVYGRTPPYQKWTGNEYDGLQGNKYIICGKGIVNNEVITGKDGTYPQPDDLSLSNYGFNLPTDAKIIKVTARWYERQINPRNSETYPKVGFGSAVLKYNDKEWGRLIGSQIPLQANAGFNIVSVAWNTPNIKVSELNSSALTVILKHDPNTNDNVGSVYLKYFEVGVSYVIEPERSILQPEEE